MLELQHIHDHTSREFGCPPSFTELLAQAVNDVSLEQILCIEQFPSQLHCNHIDFPQEFMVNENTAWNLMQLVLHGEYGPSPIIDILTLLL